MKKIIKITALALCLTSLCSYLSACKKIASDNNSGSLIHDDSTIDEYLTVENSFVSLAVGEEKNVLIDYYTKDGKNVRYSSNDEDVATVDNKGKITAQNEGVCVITVSLGDITETCTVTVGFGNEMPVLSLETFGDENIVVALGDNYGLGAVVKYNGKEYDFVPEYSLSDATVGKIENGEFIALKEGTTVLTVEGVWRGKTLLPIQTEITVNKVNEIKRNMLTVNYKNTKGVKLSESVQKFYVEGVDYSVISPEIEGYTANTVNVTGTMGENSVVIDVIYTPNVYTVTYNVGELLLDEFTQSVVYGEEYTLKNIQENAYCTWNGTWFDEDGIITANTGIWNFSEGKTLTTICSWNTLSFDNAAEKNLFTGVTSSSGVITPTVVDLDGDNVLAVSPTNGWWTQVRFNGWLDSVFTDPATLSVTFNVKVKNEVASKYYRWNIWNGTKINREYYPNPVTTEWKELTIDRILYAKMKDTYQHGGIPALDVEISSGNTVYLDDFTVHTVNEYAYKGFEDGAIQKDYSYATNKTAKYGYFLADGTEFLRLTDGGNYSVEFTDEKVMEGGKSLKITNETQSTFQMRINMTYVNSLFSCQMVDAIQFDVYSNVNAQIFCFQKTDNSFNTYGEGSLKAGTWQTCSITRDYIEGTSHWDVQVLFRTSWVGEYYFDNFRVLTK